LAVSRSIKAPLILARDNGYVVIAANSYNIMFLTHLLRGGY
jgi:hypothetical protein